MDFRTAFPNCYLKKATFDFEDKNLKGEQRPWRWVVVPVKEDYVIYELTFDMDLNKTIPNGHLYGGRCSSYDEAVSRLRSFQKERTEVRMIEK